MAAAVTASNKTDAWMPLWIGAYLADTMKLTTIQHGAYLLLLMAYWRERKALPDIDDELRSIAKMDRGEWRQARPVLSKFFRVDGGQWWHKRVEQEMADAGARSKKSTEKASNAAQARWGARAEHATSNAPSSSHAMQDGMLDECPTPSPSSIPSGKKNRPTPPQTVGIEGLIAAGLDPQLAAEFIDHKRRMKAPLTERAWADHLAESRKAGWTPQAAAAKTIARSWKGFEAKYVADEPRPANGAAASFRERDAATAAARVAEFAPGAAARPPKPLAEVIDVAARRLG